MHLQVLQAINEQLLPNVSADALRSGLVLTRIETQAQLESVRALPGLSEGSTCQTQAYRDSEAR